MKTITRIAAGICLLLVVNRGYSGLTTQAIEGDSLAYHIPIARIIADGDIWEKGRYVLPFFYYPAWGETILAGFIISGIPLNLYNVLGWGLLMGGSYKLGRVRGLDGNTAIIFASSVGLLNSVQRLILTQTVDIWLAVWFVWIVAIMEKKKRIGKDYIWLAIAFGLLVGTKYSGLMYGLILGMAYGRTWWKELRGGRAGRFLLMTGLLGGWWYLRNWRLTGNPIYPQSLGMWRGSEEFHLADWAVWKTIFLYSGGWWIFLQSIISEYLIWAISPLVIFFSKSRMAILGVGGLGVYLLLPSWPENTLSDLRYAFPAMILLMVSVFERARDKVWGEELACVAVIGGAAVLPQLDYSPKLLFGCLLFFGIWTMLKRNLSKQ